MDMKTKEIVDELKSVIGNKYKLIAMKLFGSTARNERGKDSDIDVFIHLDHVNSQIEEDIYDLSYDLELKYDCLIDLIMVDDVVLAGIVGTAPIFHKINAEATDL
jgi:predicted nucleotidyltransferase